jgi:hypothetical protein
VKKESIILTVKKDIYHDDNDESYQREIKRLISQLRRLGWNVEQEKEGVKV